MNVKHTRYKYSHKYLFSPSAYNDDNYKYIQELDVKRCVLCSRRPTAAIRIGNTDNHQICKSRLKGFCVGTSVDENSALDILRGSIVEMADNHIFYSAKVSSDGNKLQVVIRSAILTDYLFKIKQSPFLVDWNEALKTREISCVSDYMDYAHENPYFLDWVNI